MIKYFLEGLIEFQMKFKSKEYKNHREIGLVIEDYFNYAKHKSTIELEIIRENLRAWF